MLITRKIGKVVRGGVTPVQIMMACVLGGVMGFIPGFWQAPGLLIGTILVLIILNANLFLVGMVALLAKLVSLLIMPVQFAAGQVLIDGPTQPLLKSAINAPVLALFGFDHYATTGGVVLGAAFGVICGMVLVRGLKRIWAMMAGIEEGSEKYKKATSKKSVKVLSWIFLGKKKGTYAEIGAKKVGNPIRPLGAVFAVLLVVLLVLVNLIAGEQITTAIFQRGMERAHGATVDVESARIDYRTGSLVITGLAMADPKDLDVDMLRAKKIEGEVATRDLLRKRLAMNQVVVTEARQGEKRAFPGRSTRKPRPPAPPPREGKTIEEYLREAEVWKERLAQVREWLEKLQGERPDGVPQTDEEGKPVVVKRETLRERLEREINDLGYKNVRATHLVEGAPTVLVRELRAEGVRSQEFGDELLDVTAQNLSTHPALVDGPPRISVRSRGQTLVADLNLGVSRVAGPATVELALRGLSTDRVAGWLVPSDPPLIRGGTTDVAINGSIGAGTAALDAINLPLVVTLRNAVISLPKAGSANVAEFMLPVAVKGPLDNPGIVVDSKQLSDSLAKAGANELAAKARGEADKQVDRALEKVTDKLGDKVGGEAGDKAQDLIRGLIPGQRPR